MGATFQTAIVNAGLDAFEEVREEFKAATDEMRREEGDEGYSGTMAEKTDVRNSGVVTPSPELAREYLTEACEKYGPALAVFVELSEHQRYWLIGAWCAE